MEGILQCFLLGEVYIPEKERASVQVSSEWRKLLQSQYSHGSGAERGDEGAAHISVLPLPITPDHCSKQGLQFGWIAPNLKGQIWSEMQEPRAGSAQMSPFLFSFCCQMEEGG